MQDAKTEEVRKKKSSQEFLFVGINILKAKQHRDIYRIKKTLSTKKKKRKKRMSR